MNHSIKELVVLETPVSQNKISNNKLLVRHYLENNNVQHIIKNDNNYIDTINSMLISDGYKPITPLKTFNITLFDEYNYEVALLKEHYASNNREAIIVIDLSDGDIFSDFTVNIPYANLSDNEYIYNINNGSKELLKKLQEESLISFTDKTVRSGFVEYPIIKFTDGSEKTLFEHNDILHKILSSNY